MVVGDVYLLQKTQHLDVPLVEVCQCTPRTVLRTMLGTCFQLSSLRSLGERSDVYVACLSVCLLKIFENKEKIITFHVCFIVFRYSYWLRRDNVSYSLMVLHFFDEIQEQLVPRRRHKQLSLRRIFFQTKALYNQFNLICYT